MNVKMDIKKLAYKSGWNHQYKINGFKTIPNQKKSIGNNIIKWNRIIEKCNFNNKKVLDLACSDGYFSVEACKNGASYVEGIDLDEERIERANYVKNYYNYKNIDFHIKDVYQMDLREQKYDIILCLGLLHRIPDIDALIDKMCSSDSLIIIETKIWDSKKPELLKKPNETKFNKLNILYHVPSYLYLEQHLKKHGYNNIQFDIHPEDTNNYKRGLLICSKN